MNLYSTQVFKELPAGLASTLQLQTFSSDKITLFKVKNVFAEPKGFPCYKFIIPHTKGHPLARVEKKIYKMKKDHLFPLNPDQAHGSEVQQEVDWYSPLFVDKGLLQEMAKIIFGRSAADLSFENQNFQLTPQLTNLLQQFALESEQKQPGFEFILQSLNTQIIIQLLRTMRTNLSADPVEFKSAERKAIHRAIDFLQANYQDNFSLDDLAEQVNYSPFHFIRIFKEETGKTPFEYFLEVKIEKAKELLRYTDYSVTEICFRCGFNNRSHFSTTFKRHVGVSPSEYRKAF